MQSEPRRTRESQGSAHADLARLRLAHRVEMAARRARQNSRDSTTIARHVPHKRALRLPIVQAERAERAAHRAAVKQIMMMAPRPASKHRSDPKHPSTAEERAEKVRRRILRKRPLLGGLRP